VLLFTIYWVHGVNRKTTAALLGTLASVLFVLLLSLYFVGAMGFTGLASEEALLLKQWGGVDLLSLYLAGVVVGALGALTDVTVTQAAVVQALAHANPRFGLWELYRRGMEVGYDHIGSLVNTLVLAYAAGSLPLFLLLTKDPTPCASSSTPSPSPPRSPPWSWAPWAFSWPCPSPPWWRPSSSREGRRGPGSIPTGTEVSAAPLK
jgi:uncharacterized membrane protein